MFFPVLGRILQLMNSTTVHKYSAGHNFLYLFEVPSMLTRQGTDGIGGELHAPSLYSYLHLQAKIPSIRSRANGRRDLNSETFCGWVDWFLLPGGRSRCLRGFPDNFGAPLEVASASRSPPPAPASREQRPAARRRRCARRAGVPWGAWGAAVMDGQLQVGGEEHGRESKSRGMWDRRLRTHF